MDRNREYQPSKRQPPKIVNRTKDGYFKIEDNAPPRYQYNPETRKYELVTDQTTSASKNNDSRAEGDKVRQRNDPLGPKPGGSAPNLSGGSTRNRNDQQPANYTNQNGESTRTLSYYEKIFTGGSPTNSPPMERSARPNRSANNVNEPPTTSRTNASSRMEQRRRAGTDVNDRSMYPAIAERRSSLDQSERRKIDPADKDDLERQRQMEEVMERRRRLEQERRKLVEMEREVMEKMGGRRSPVSERRRPSDEGRRENSSERVKPLTERRRPSVEPGEVQRERRPVTDRRRPSDDPVETRIPAERVRPSIDKRRPSDDPVDTGRDAATERVRPSIDRRRPSEDNKEARREIPTERVRPSIDRRRPSEEPVDPRKIVATERERPPAERRRPSDDQIAERGRAMIDRRRPSEDIALGRREIPAERSRPSVDRRRPSEEPANIQKDLLSKMPPSVGAPRPSIENEIQSESARFSVDRKPPSEGPNQSIRSSSDNSLRSDDPVSMRSSREELNGKRQLLSKAKEFLVNVRRTSLKSLGLKPADTPASPTQETPTYDSIPSTPQRDSLTKVHNELDELAGLIPKPENRRPPPPVTARQEPVTQRESIISNSTATSSIYQKAPSGVLPSREPSLKAPEKINNQIFVPAPTPNITKEEGALPGLLEDYSGDTESDEPEMTEAEKLEMEKSRRELEVKQREKKEADKREADLIKEARLKKSRAERKELSRRGSNGQEFTLSSSKDGDDEFIPVEYVDALRTTLRNDKTVSPTPVDFNSPDSYAVWRSSMQLSFQEIISNLLKYKYLEKEAPVNQEVQLNMKLIQGRNFVLKEGKPRSTHCDIEYGDFSVKVKNREVFRTDVIQNNTNPMYNQRMTLTLKSQNDQMAIRVFDTIKDHFLGQVILNLSDVVAQCKETGSYDTWKTLEPRGKSKDKYVGGEIQIAFSLVGQNSSNVGSFLTQKIDDKSYAGLQQSLMEFDVKNQSLFIVLLRSCLILDIYTPRDGRLTILSPESVNLLKVWAKDWSIDQSFQSVAYLKVVFESYVSGSISITDVKIEVELMYNFFKKNNIKDLIMEECHKVIEDIKHHCSDLVVNYREEFPKNQPPGQLEDTILVLRLVHKFPGFRDRHPDIPESFKDELKYLMTESAISKFQTMKQATAAEDPDSSQSVLESVIELAQLVDEGIEMDLKYFKPAFAAEMDLVRLTAESHLKYFASTLEDCDDILQDPNAPSQLVFELYRTIKAVSQSYAKSVPGLTNFSVEYIEDWFAPYVSRWLQQLSKKTLGWVQTAVKADKFELIPNELYSSSIVDVFASLYTELEFVKGLEWSDENQNGQFIKAFAQTLYQAIDEYCDALHGTDKVDYFSSLLNSNETVTNLTSNLKEGSEKVSNFTQNIMATTAVTNFTNNLMESTGKVTNFTQNLLGNNTGAVTAFTNNIIGGTEKVSNFAQTLLGVKEVEPEDINEEVCTKLRNLEYAQVRVKELHQQLNVSKYTKSNGRIRESKTQEVVSGTFNIDVCYGENIRPSNISGSCNPYMVIRLPEGTQEAASVPMKTKRGSMLMDKKPTVRTGRDCILLKTQSTKDTLNPTWDEKKSVVVPPIDKLLIQVYTKNLVASDELVGTAEIDLGPSSKLRKRLFDYQSHEVYCNLVPQGRILIRLTLEGESDDVGFWFRKTNETIKAASDAFLRMIADPVTPYLVEVLTKSTKNNEAAPIPSTSYFQAFTTTVEYSDMTFGGKPVNEKASEQEADNELFPLIDYLEKNFVLLCIKLPPEMSKAVILKFWKTILTILINLLVPPLYGYFSQKPLNLRQTSMFKHFFKILREFFHGDGGELGIPMDILNSSLAESLLHLIKFYHMDIPKVKKEYEQSISSSGGERELLLRLVRVRSIEGSEDYLWVEKHLLARNEGR